MKHRQLGSPGWTLVFLLGPIVIGVLVAIALPALKMLRDWMATR